MENKKHTSPPSYPELSSLIKSALNIISAQFPDLKKRLLQADMPDEPTNFVAKSIISAFLMGIIVSFSLPIVLSLLGLSIYFIIPLFPIIFFLMFLYAMKLPEVRTSQRMRELNKDLVFAGRQMLIELKGGVPLFNAMLGISRGHGEVSKEFNKIMERVNMGDPIDIAMQEVAELNPSPHFRRVIMQLINSIRSGSDVASALETVLEQVSQEQLISLKSYGQTLNPLAMFYMLIGVLLPLLGIILVIILTSFINIKITFDLLLIILIMQIFLQYVFLTLIKSTRPHFDIG